MKINNDDSLVNVRSLQSPQSEKTETKKPRHSSPHNSDQVQLSSRSKEFNRIKEVVENTPDERENKVAELKASIQDGSYSVDSEAVAQNMIQEHIIDLIM